MFEQARSGDGAVLVTWPIKKVVKPVFFASTMIEPEVSRTWAMLPGADGIAEENRVWTESITISPGLIFLT